MQNFLNLWHEAAITSLGFFWMALWAFILGYFISSLIQILVTQRRMKETMGKDGPKSIFLGSFFGFISSSCSFAALSTTRAIFQKGAGLAPSIAFLLASTNLVIELGIVIAIFLGWQFVVGEYVGGILLILFSWLFIRLTNPRRMIQKAREKLGDDKSDGQTQDKNWKEKISSRKGWESIGQTYIMEWQMVWKDVLIGFTLAGIIAAFVPNAFFESLFIGSASSNNPGFLSVLAQAIVGPLAAFFTFIGSMGNIPLAALLFDHGVSFAGVMAFIFSDLVVLPVLRINASYYGWKMALYILLMLLSGLVVTALLLHYGLVALDMLPTRNLEASITERDFFQLDYTTWLNVAFLLVSCVLAWLWREAMANHQDHGHDHGDNSLSQKILSNITIVAVIWLVIGMLIGFIIGNV